MIGPGPKIACPGCGHVFDEDDFEGAAVDLWAIAPNEETVHIDCPQCDVDFWAEGGYIPIYRTALEEDELL